VSDEAEVGPGLAGAERHPERVEDQIGARVTRELPADHTPAEHVDDEREVDDAFPAAQIRQITDP